MSGGGHGTGGGRRRGHEEEHEEHENHERWLVSYADMMTLLMVLFIVMFAISQVDSKKFAALKTGLASGFGAPVAFLAGGDQLLDPGGSVAPDSVQINGGTGNTQTEPQSSQAKIDPEAVSKLAQATENAQVKQEVENLQEAQKELETALEKAGENKKATFRFDERGLVVTIATDEVLFASGGAQLSAEGRKILNSLAPTLEELPNRLSIDGHTNSIPISTAQFPSNWELSTSRATGVLRFLHAEDGIPFGRMSATGFADTEPLVPGTSAKALTANRRVEIVILARVDDSAGRAVENLGNEGTSTGATPIGNGPLTATDPSGTSGGISEGAQSNRDAIQSGASSAADQLSR